MIKVEALDTFEKNNVKDAELNRIPKKGETWNVSENRLKVLLGENKMKLVFVKEVPTKIETKKPTRKTTIKRK